MVAQVDPAHHTPRGGVSQACLSDSSAKSERQGAEAVVGLDVKTDHTRSKHVPDIPLTTVVKPAIAVQTAKALAGSIFTVHLSASSRAVGWTALLVFSSLSLSFFVCVRVR